jgi:SAM-dependent methyltransferase
LAVIARPNSVDDRSRPDEDRRISVALEGARRRRPTPNGTPGGHNGRMLHSDRRRAESFGGFADEYDRLRPTYPDALIEFIAPEGHETILDVGCGTGKAAHRFLERGCKVLGLDIDERMAEVARRHGVDVEVSAFEEWEPAGRTFDVVTAGQAWHWVDPLVGPRKAESVLRQKGRLTVFWNYGHPRDAAVEAAIENAYESATPAIAEKKRRQNEWRHAEESLRHKSEIESSRCFASIEIHTFPWEWRVSPDHWIQMQRTHSEISLLPDEQRSLLLDRLAAALETVDDDLVLDYEAFCIAAVKP